MDKLKKFHKHEKALSLKVKKLEDLVQNGMSGVVSNQSSRINTSLFKQSKIVGNMDVQSFTYMGNNSINEIDNLMHSSKGGSQFLSSTVVSKKNEAVVVGKKSTYLGS